MASVFFNTLSLIGFLLSVLVSASLSFAGRWPAALGVLVGALWIFLNSFFLFQLLEMSIHRKARQKDRILLFSVFKFPVLYVAGYFILKSRFFPIYSLLVGLTLFLAAFGLAWIRVQRAAPEEGLPSKF